MRPSLRTLISAACAAVLALALVLTAERAKRFETCLVCGTVRAESSLWSLPVGTSIEEKDGFTSWVRQRAPDHDEHEWVYSHTLTGGELECSKSPFPYFLSGLYANVGPTPEVEALLDELLAQLRSDSVDEPGLLARAAKIRAESRTLEQPASPEGNR